MKIKIILLLFFAIICTNCKKENNDERSDGYHYRINPSLYPFLFDTGSYWVYKNISTQAIDSIVLVNVNKNAVYVIPPPKPNYQGSLDQIDYCNFTYSCFPSDSSFDEQIFSLFISKCFTDGCYIYFEGTVGETSNYSKIVAVFDTIIVANQVYKNVVKMKFKLTLDSIDYYYYYADSIGIVRKETAINDSIVVTKDLIRHNTQLFTYP